VLVVVMVVCVEAQHCQLVKMQLLTLVVVVEEEVDPLKEKDLVEQVVVVL
tara:strand:- start:136 stop:285 length:150 start_codon:yes stop_codon:yes gene_type:complete